MNMRNQMQRFNDTRRLMEAQTDSFTRNPVAPAVTLPEESESVGISEALFTAVAGDLRQLVADLNAIDRARPGEGFQADTEGGHVPNGS